MESKLYLPRNNKTHKPRKFMPTTIPIKMHNLTSFSCVPIKSINMKNTNLVRKSDSWVILVHNPVGPNPTTNTNSIED